MSISPATGNIAGQIEPISGDDQEHAYNNCDNGVAFLRGDVVVWAATGIIKKAVAADKGKFGVCVKAKAQTATYSWIYEKPGGYVSVVADGAIKPGALVKVGAAAGRVQAFVLGTDDATLAVGTYEKRYQYVPEGDGVTAPADAAQNDIILIRLRQ